MHDSTHLRIFPDFTIFNKSANVSSSLGKAGSESFRKVSCFYKQKKESLKAEYRKNVRDVCRKLCDEQIESGGANLNDLTQKLRDHVKVLQRKYLTERSKIKNRILGNEIHFLFENLCY